MAKTKELKKLKTKPVSLTQAIAEEIVRRYASGETIKSICEDPDMPSRGAIYLWLADDRDTRSTVLIAWQDAMAKARTAHAFAMADDVIDIADDGTNDYVTKERPDGSTYEAVNSEHIQRSKLRVDTRLKLVEKLAPEQFGNALQLTGANGGPIKIENSPKDTARRLAFALALGAQKASNNDEQSE
jgi:hypothetical protein